MASDDLEPHQRYAIDLLVGPPSDLIPEHVIPQRRNFFRHLVVLNAQNGGNLTSPPFISKLPIDLHRLYISVLRRGGYVQVTKDKSWKVLCSEANPQLSDSSAAGYQLRLNYQKYLLELECSETGQEVDELIAFSETLKRKKKEEQEGSSKKKKPKKEDLNDTFNSTGDVDEEDEILDVVGISGPEVTKKSKKKASTQTRRSTTAAIQPEEQTELETMSQEFKKKRMELNYSQKEVAESIGGVFSTEISQTTISRYETIKLSAKNMRSVKLLIDDWVEKVDEALAEGKTAVTFLKDSKAAAKESAKR